MINFFVLYVAPLVFMTFVYVRISITLWRSSTIQSLPLINIHFLQNDNSQQQQQQQQRGRVSNTRYLQHSPTSRSTSAIRLSISYPNSPTGGSATRLSLQSAGGDSNKRSSMHALNNISTAAAATAGGANQLTLVNALTLRRNTASSTSLAGLHQRRSTHFFNNTTDHNPLTSRRKVVRLLAAIVISFALCMLPHHTRVQWHEWRSARSYSYEEMYIPPITTLVFYINSALNPLLYALISDKFRQAFADLRCCRHSANAPPL